MVTLNEFFVALYFLAESPLSTTFGYNHTHEVNGRLKRHMASAIISRIAIRSAILQCSDSIGMINYGDIPFLYNDIGNGVRSKVTNG